MYLDAWPCNAHTTAGEALWFGVPVVTVGGTTFAQRVASSLLRTVGLRSWLCRQRRLPRDGRRAGRGPGASRRAADVAARAASGSPLFDGAASPATSSSSTEDVGRCVAGVRPEHLPAARPHPRPGARMKAVILAGGLGTRLAEETAVRPKPMVEIGGKPVLWHILKIYSHHGINDFVICLGYKGYMIKEYFANYFLHMSDVTFDLADNRMEVCHRHCRAVAGDPGRHRRATPDRRPPEARRASTSTTAPSASPMATASPTSTSPRRSPSTAQQHAWRR